MTLEPTVTAFALLKRAINTTGIQTMAPCGNPTVTYNSIEAMYHLLTKHKVLYLLHLQFQRLGVP
jgi:hypothetical protein